MKKTAMQQHIEDMHKIIEFVKASGTDKETEADLTHAILGAIENAESHLETEIKQINNASQFRPKWIKIESESDLPTEYGDYIVRLKSGKVKGAAYYAESKRFYTGGNVNDNPVTHWMPLPQPPKED